jgi:hypothetical protein
MLENEPIMMPFLFLQRNLNAKASQRDIAAQRLLELLIELRAVILQDVAVLQRMDKYHDHPIIYHHFFEGPEWDDFAQAVWEMSNAPEAPPEFVNFPPAVSRPARFWSKICDATSAYLLHWKICI